MNTYRQAECFRDAALFVDNAIDILPREAWRKLEVDLLREQLSDVRDKVFKLSNAAFQAADEAMAEKHARNSVIASLQDLIEEAEHHAAGSSVLPALQECLEKLK